MAAQMPLSLYYEWLAYAMRINPLAFNDEYRTRRGELQLAIVASTFHNVQHGLWAKHPKFKQGQDYVLPPVTVKKKSPKEMYQALKFSLMARGMLNANN